MQHRYVGDVGDFGKFGLLRVLGGLGTDRVLKIGVVWYLYPDEGHNSDGKHIGYLRKRDRIFRDCDEALFDKLRELLFDENGLIAANRDLAAVETAGLLPDGAIFFSKPLSYAKTQTNRARLALRNDWMAEALP